MRGTVCMQCELDERLGLVDSRMTGEGKRVRGCRREKGGIRLGRVRLFGWAWETSF